MLSTDNVTLMDDIMQIHVVYSETDGLTAAKTANNGGGGRK